MNRALTRLLIRVAAGQIACVDAADEVNEPARKEQEDRACSGVANEGAKMRELRREMSVYYGNPVPEDLERRVRKHIGAVARLEAECDAQRGRAALAR